MNKKDLGASVRQRLLNQAREQGRPFQELLPYYVMERFLYRLSKIKVRNASVLSCRSEGIASFRAIVRVFEPSDMQVCLVSLR